MLAQICKTCVPIDPLSYKELNYPCVLMFHKLQVFVSIKK